MHPAVRLAAAVLLLPLASCEHVGEAPELLASPSSLQLTAIGDTALITPIFTGISLTAPTSDVVTWASDNPSTATVLANGLVRAVGPGTANITVRRLNRVYTVPVTVTQLPTALVLGPPVQNTFESALLSGQTLQLYARVTDRNGYDLVGGTVAWSSLNPQVASVSSTGVVTALQTGQGSVRARVGLLSETILFKVCTGQIC